MAGAGGDQGAPGPELPGAAGAAKVAGLEARVAALKAALAELEAAEAAQRRVADLAPLRVWARHALSVAQKRGEVAAAERQLAWQRARLDPAWRDWAAGLPDQVLEKVASALVAQTEAGWAAQLKERGNSEGYIQQVMARRKRDGNCLFVFARVCKEWWKAQLKVGGPLRTRVHSDVAMPGRVALAKWALAEGCPRERPGSNMASAAAEYGHLELVRWLIQEQGFAMDVWVMWNAARGGNLELVRWLRGEGCQWGTETCDSAAEAGRLGVLQWLRAQGCPWNINTCNAAAKNGHLETLRWARENGCPWDAGACYHAAAGGHLEILQWLRAEGCPWDWCTCRYAVEDGHVEVLRWARANGCPWRAYTRDKAAAELGYTDDLDNLL